MQKKNAIVACRKRIRVSFAVCFLFFLFFRPLFAFSPPVSHFFFSFFSFYFIFYFTDIFSIAFRTWLLSPCLFLAAISTDQRLKKKENGEPQRERGSLSFWQSTSTATVSWSVLHAYWKKSSPARCIFVHFGSSLWAFALRSCGFLAFCYVSVQHSIQQGPPLISANILALWLFSFSCPFCFLESSLLLEWMRIS